LLRNLQSVTHISGIVNAHSAEQLIINLCDFSVLCGKYSKDGSLRKFYPVRKSKLTLTLA